MNRIIRRLAVPATCATLGFGFALACVTATDGSLVVPNTARSVQSPAVSTLTPLTPEQIDVLAEGDDWDHPWESCSINTDYWVTCPDGAWVEYPAPDEPGDDGSITDPGALAAALDLPACTGEDAEPDLPCHLQTTPTYVVGGDGVRHDGCYVVLTTAEDSEMVCRDDTVWAS